jgi:hypothetical protein
MVHRLKPEITRDDKRFKHDVARPDRIRLLLEDLGYLPEGSSDIDKA